MFVTLLSPLASLLSPFKIRCHGRSVQGPIAKYNHDQIKKAVDEPTALRWLAPGEDYC
jgi:hypothetical protein